MSGGRFTFRLQRLLALRLMAERAAAIKLGTAQTAANEALAVQASLAARRADSRDAIAVRPGTARGVAELRRGAFLVEQMDLSVAEAAKTAGAADQRVHESRALLGERVQERRMLERLRERHFSEWLHGEERHDREVMDSIKRRQIDTTPESNSSPVPRP